MNDDSQLTPAANFIGSIDVSEYIANWTFDPDAMKDVDYTQFGSRHVPYGIDWIEHRSDNWYCTIEGCTWHWLDDSGDLAALVEEAEAHLADAHPDGWEPTYTGLTKGATITVSGTFEDASEQMMTEYFERLDAMFPPDGRTITVSFDGSPDKVRIVRRTYNEDGTTTYHFDPMRVLSADEIAALGYIQSPVRE